MRKRRKRLVLLLLLSFTINEESDWSPTSRLFGCRPQWKGELRVSTIWIHSWCNLGSSSLSSWAQTSHCQSVIPRYLSFLSFTLKYFLRVSVHWCSQTLEKVFYPEVLISDFDRKFVYFSSILTLWVKGLISFHHYPELPPTSLSGLSDLIHGDCDYLTHPAWYPSIVSYHFNLPTLV